MILPHRAPMLLADEGRIGFDDDNRAIVAESKFYIDPEWEVMKGHFPEAPVMPGNLITEALAQCADLMIMSEPENEGKLPMLVATQMRFIRPAVPEETLLCKAEIIQTFDDGLYDCGVSAQVGEEKIAQGMLTLCVR